MIYQQSSTSTSGNSAGNTAMSSTSRGERRGKAKCKGKARNVRKRNSENKTPCAMFESLCDYSNVTNGIINIPAEKVSKIVKKEPIEKYYVMDNEPFATGLFATVWRCRHRETGDVFAAKFAERRRYGGSDCTSELLHEIALLSLLSSYHRIIRLQDVFETEENMIIVMEYASGGDLQTIIDDDMVPFERDVVVFIRQLLEGLVYIHEKKIAHLDIKPQNLVMMGTFPDCDVKLCDFEISRVILDGAEVREILGTPDYVAPEVLQFDPITLQADMWSVGVLTYVLLTGFSPFAGDTDQETFWNICQSQLDFPQELFEDISSHARDFISRLIVREPSARITSKASLAHPWITGSAPMPKTLPLVTSSNGRQSGQPTTSTSPDTTSSRTNRAGHLHSLRRNVSKSREALYEKVAGSSLRKNLSKSRERLWEMKMSLSKSRDRLFELRKSREHLYGLKSLSKSHEVLPASGMPWDPYSAGNPAINPVWRLARLTSPSSGTGSVECIMGRMTNYKDKLGSNDSLASSFCQYTSEQELVQPEQVHKKEVEVGKAITVTSSSGGSSVADKCTQGYETLVEVPEDSSEEKSLENISNIPGEIKLLHENKFQFLWSKSQSEPLLMSNHNIPITEGNSQNSTKNNECAQQQEQHKGGEDRMDVTESLGTDNKGLEPTDQSDEGEEPQRSVAQLIETFNKQCDAKTDELQEPQDPLLRRHSVAVSNLYSGEDKKTGLIVVDIPTDDNEDNSQTRRLSTTRQPKFNRNLSPSPVRKCLRSSWSPVTSIVVSEELPVEDTKPPVPPKPYIIVPQSDKTFSDKIADIITSTKENSKDKQFIGTKQMTDIFPVTEFNDDKSETLNNNDSIIDKHNDELISTKVLLQYLRSGSHSSEGDSDLSLMSWEDIDKMSPLICTATRTRHRSGSAQVEITFPLAQPWGRVCVGSVARAMEKFQSKSGSESPNGRNRSRRKSSPLINPLI